MSIGMAVNSGMNEEKAELFDLLEVVRRKSIELDLWVNGMPFEFALRQICIQLNEGRAIKP